MLALLVSEIQLKMLVLLVLGAQMLVLLVSELQVKILGLLSYDSIRSTSEVFALLV